MSLIEKFLTATAASLLWSGMALAQTADTIVVFDGSGSMWGQIDGRTKIEIARDTLSTVLSEIPPQTRIGMVAYGHRQKGVCSDIETVVAVGPAGQSVPRMISVANKLQPKGKTPLSDAVRFAAKELRSTENTATVILITDGVETCNADPCALATELEKSGVGFTAHVVGFGLSKEEGRQVQCLADNTGGLYLSANNADELSNALRKTVQAREIVPDPSDFEPVNTTRNVRFIWRDVDDGPQVGLRQLEGSVETVDGQSVEKEAFKFAYPEASGNSAFGTLEPGNYVAVLRRKGGERGGYSTRFAFTVPEGQGEHVVEGSLASSLTIRPFFNPQRPYNPKVSSASAVRDRVWAYFSVYAVKNGVVADEPIVTNAYDNLKFPLSSGIYLIRGNIDRTTSAEKLVKVDGVTEIDFSFDVTRVFVDAKESNGASVKRQTTYWYDKIPKGRNYWTSGGGQNGGSLTPFYLPTGSWITNVGGEGYGARRSEVVVNIPGDFKDIRVGVGEGEKLDDDKIGLFNAPSRSGCVEILKVKYSGCLIAKAELSGSTKTQTAPVETDKPTSADKADIPRDLDGLGGTAYAFEDSKTGRSAYVVFDPALGDKAMVVLETAWCGNKSCAGRRFTVRASGIKGLQSDTQRSGGFFSDDFKLEYAVYSSSNKVLFVTPNGQKKFRFNLRDTLTLSGNSAPTPTLRKTSEIDPTNAIAEISGADYVFVDANKVPRVHIVFPSSQAGDATIVLEQGWCGSPQCKADSITVAQDRVKHVLDEGFNAQSFSVDSYRFDISTFGKDKELLVTGAGASRVFFRFFDKIELGSGGKKASRRPSPPASKVSLSDRINRAYGIFNLDRSGVSIEKVVGDFLHTQQCQRRQTVIYPDGYIAIKKFEAPKSQNDNPFKTIASGQCRVAGVRYECTLKDAKTGTTDQIAFTSELIGNNHYKLQEDGKAKPTLAAACFYPGVETAANTVMANGRPLAEMILERPDGQPSGMGFDKNNNIFKGQ